VLDAAFASAMVIITFERLRQTQRQPAANDL
jgi:hypothetical protein